MKLKSIEYDEISIEIISRSSPCMKQHSPVCFPKVFEQNLYKRKQTNFNSKFCSTRIKIFTHFKNYTRILGKQKHNVLFKQLFHLTCTMCRKRTDVVRTLKQYFQMFELILFIIFMKFLTARKFILTRYFVFAKTVIVHVYDQHCYMSHHQTLNTAQNDVQRLL